MTKVNPEDLKYKSEMWGSENYGKYIDGFKVVYFYEDGRYNVGAYAASIELFMYDFAKIAPIESIDDIPPFISIDDILTRYLNDLKDITAVAIYKTNGEEVAKKYRNELN